MATTTQLENRHRPRHLRHRGCCRHRLRTATARPSRPLSPPQLALLLVLAVVMAAGLAVALVVVVALLLQLLPLLRSRHYRHPGAVRPRESIDLTLTQDILPTPSPSARKI